MKINSLRTVLAAALLGTASSAIAATEYLEDFSNDGSPSATLSSIGWNAYVIDNDGSVNDLSDTTFGVAEAYNISSGSYGYTRPAGSVSYNESDNLGLIFTTETTAALDSTSIADIISLSVDLSIDGSSEDPATARFAIQMEDTWYVSILADVSTTQDGQNFTSFTTSELFDFTDGNNWYELTVSTGAGGEITIADSVVGGTLSGDITAFGLYAENGNDITGGDHFRFDNYSITIIPEPSTFALLSGALALSAVMFRRRRA
jgi:hypothetical protein